MLSHLFRVLRKTTQGDLILQEGLKPRLTVRDKESIKNKERDVDKESEKEVEHEGNRLISGR